MRKLLLLIVFISGNVMFGQVGIGTDLPNESTQLEIVSSNRGILIPQVPLTDITDRTTITAGNIPSLMVYNTSSNATMEPGYYYWFQNRWRRMISDTDVAGFSDALVDNGDGTFTHTAVDGTVIIFDANTTTYVNNGDGTYTFTNANGASMTIDVIGDVINNIINEGDIYDEIIDIILQNTDELVDNGDGTFTHTAVDGTVLVFDANTTSYVNNGDGTYTFTNANGATMTIDVIGDVVNNIINEGDIYDEIINIILQNSDELVDNGDGTFTHTAVDGTVLIFDANTTTFVDNGDGTYTFTNDNGESMLVDVIGDVVTNIQNQGDIYDEIINIVLQNSDELVDNGDGTFTHTAVDGTVLIFDANTTSYVNNGDGTYTFTNANGDSMTIDVIGDVVTNIQNQGDIYDEIINIVLQNSDELVDNGDGTFTHTAVDGTVLVFDANTTSYANNGDGTYTFTNANGDSMTIDIIADVVTNIQNQGDIYDEIVNLVDLHETLTVLTDNGDGTFTYTDENGDDWDFDANTTTMVDNGDGTYDFTNANGDTITVDVIGDVVTNIQNQGDIYNEIVNLIDLHETLTELTYDENENTLTYTDEEGNVHTIQLNNTDLTYDDINQKLVYINSKGETQEIDLGALVAGNETITTLVDHGDGTFTYTNEEGTDVTFDATRSNITDNGDGTYTVIDANGNPVTIDIPGDFVLQFGNIVKNGPVIVDGNTYNSIEEYIEHLINVNETLTELTYDEDENQLSYKDENGDSHTIQLNNTDLSYNTTDQKLIYTNSKGETQEINLGALVTGNETVTDIANNGDGTYTYTNEAGDTFVIDVPASVVEN